MEKIVNIGGTDYRLKSTAANLLKYKAQFGRDLLDDIQTISAARLENGGWDFTKVDLEVLYDMVWLLIKAADPSLPPPMEWLDTLDTFPLKDAATAAINLYLESMSGTVKNAQAAQAAAQ